MNASLIEILFYICCVIFNWFTLFLIGVFEYRQGDVIPFGVLIAGAALTLLPVFNVAVFVLSLFSLWFLNDFDHKLTSLIKRIFK